MEDGENAQGNFFCGKGPVTLEGIRGCLPPQDYDTLTVGDDANGERCLLAARLRCRADIRSTGNEYDEDVPEVRLALAKLWIYELYAFVGQQDEARSAWEDYSLVIRTGFGQIQDKGQDAADGAGPAVAYVSRPEKKGRGFRGRCRH